MNAALALVTAALSAAMASAPPVLLRVEMATAMSLPECLNRAAAALQAAGWSDVAVAAQEVNARKTAHRASIVCVAGRQDGVVPMIVVAGADGEPAAQAERDRLHRQMGGTPAAPTASAVRPADCPPGRSAHLRVERSCFTAGEKVQFWFAGLDRSSDWITLIQADAPGSRYGQWRFSAGTELERAGEFNAPAEPGNYELRVYYDWPKGGYTVRDRLPVGILPGPPRAEPRVEDLTQPQDIGWSHNVVSLRGRNGLRVEYRCPANGAAGTVWGSGPYTDDSSICMAAVHGGLISLRRGGPVTIEIRPGTGSYSGRSRNGVDTRSYGSWQGSFVLINESGKVVE